ncbi:MAG: thioredoxin family protein [Chitinophagales bacterium]
MPAVLFLLTAGLLITVLPVRGADEIAVVSAKPGSGDDSTKEDFHWYSINESLSLQKETNKKIFMDVFTTWCGPCRMLDQGTFSNPVIRGLLDKYYLPTKFNAEGNDTVTYNGQTFVNQNYSPQARKSTHQFAIYIASRPEGLGYPTMVFLDEQGNMIQPIAGYLTPQQLEPILVFFGTDAYKTTDWNTFLQNFNSALTQQ